MPMKSIWIPSEESWSVQIYLFQLLGTTDGIYSRIPHWNTWKCEEETRTRIERVCIEWPSTSFRRFFLFSFKKKTWTKTRSATHRRWRSASKLQWTQVNHPPFDFFLTIDCLELISNCMKVTMIEIFFSILLFFVIWIHHLVDVDIQPTYIRVIIKGKVSVFVPKS